MGRNKKLPLLNTTPESVERRADRLQYWLQQRGLPDPGSATYKSKLTVFDKMIIGMIEKATEGNAAAGNWVMENAFGKNTEGADITNKGGNTGARFNIPKSVSELNKEKDNKDD